MYSNESILTLDSILRHRNNSIYFKTNADPYQSFYFFFARHNQYNKSEPKSGYKL